MKRVLMVFAWVGLVIGVVAGSFMAAAAAIAVEDGADTILVWLPPVAYILGSLFWFALCSVLAETLERVESAQRRIEALHHEVKQLRA